MNPDKGLLRSRQFVLWLMFCTAQLLLLGVYLLFTANHSMTYRLICAFGVLVLLILGLTAAKSAYSKVDAATGVLADIVLLLSLFMQKSAQDPLTGIRNRRFFDKAYIAGPHRSRREQTLRDPIIKTQGGPIRVTISCTVHTAIAQLKTIHLPLTVQVITGTHQ